MAYQALYRKYRPNSFEGVAGQRAIVQTLINAVKRQKIAHAYLFCGPRGTGKTSIAKIFAKMLNCEHQDQAPCGKCKNCQDFQKGAHPDIIEIDAASNNGVDEVRNLIEKIKYAPMEGKYKVYIIDEVHMMTPGAFNALLKTIEEPPAHVIFIFATTEPHKVLPTIISRCQRFDFNKVSVKDITERLHYVLEQEHVQMEEEAVRAIAVLADGGMRDALSILDQCIAYAQNEIRVSDVNAIYGITTPEEKGKLLQNVVDKNYLEMVNQIESLNEKGIDIRRLTSDLIDLLKDSMIYSLTEDESLISSAHLSVIQHIVSAISTARRFEMLDVLMDTFEKYRNASDVLSYFEVAMLKLLEIEDQKIIEREDEKQPKVISQKEAVTLKDTCEGNASAYQETKTASAPSVSLMDHQETKSEIEETSKTSVFPEEKETDLSVSRETPSLFDESIEQEEPKAIDTGQSSLFESEEPKQKVNVPEDKEPSLLIDDTYVLRLLTGANKQERQQDDEKFREIQEYLNELEWAKYANAVKNTEIVASAKTYLVLSVNSTIEAKEINQIERKEGFASFMNQLLGISKKIFAIDHEQRKRVITRFKELMIQGQLPEPVHIEIKKEKKEKIKEKTTEEKLVDLFGDEIVIMEE